MSYDNIVGVSPDRYRAYYLKNREKILERVARYKRANRERYNELNRAYKKRNPEKLAAYAASSKHLQKIRDQRRYEKSSEQFLQQCKDRYAKNKEVILGRNAKYRAENRDAVRIQQRKYTRQKLLTDPAFKFIADTRRRMLNALNGVGAKSARTVELLGCTGEQAVAYLEKKFKPGMSWDNRSAWHIDHIKPLASFDLTQAEQQRTAFHYSNLQPLWAQENRRKGKKLA